MNLGRVITTSGASVLFSCLGSNGVYAQSTESSGDKLEEVVVTGYRESLEAALDAKRDSVAFMDSITAEDVGKLPDNNLAEALQRVPGVQISRTNGEGQQISIRGMGPSFARVLLDGMPISVASEGSVDQQARNREFDFDLLPSEIFSMLQVSKTPRASLVEGGLSGTLDLRTPRPFDYQDFTASYQLQGAYQESSEEVDPRASFLISQNWDDKFGILLSVSASERTFRTDGWTSQGWTSGRIPGNPPLPGYAGGFDWNLPSVLSSTANEAPSFVNESGLTNAQLANAQVPRLGRPEVQVGSRDRLGGTLAMQWRPSDTLQFNLDVLYAELQAEFGQGRPSGSSGNDRGDSWNRRSGEWDWEKLQTLADRKRAMQTELQALDADMRTSAQKHQKDAPGASKRLSKAAEDVAESRTSAQLARSARDIERGRALELFGKVIQHPRCVNCHPPDDSPRQGDEALLHDPPVVRGPDDHGVAAVLREERRRDEGIADEAADGLDLVLDDRCGF